MDDATAFAGAFMGLRLMDGTGAEECSLSIYGDGTGGGVLESAGGVTIDHPFTVRFPLQFEWTLVVMNVDHEAQTFDLTVNRDTVFSNTQSLSTACTLTGHVAVAPGVHCSPDLPAGSGEVRIDDLRIAYNPL